MNVKKLLLLLFLLDFTAVGVWAIYEMGLMGFFEAATSSAWALQITFDLVVALTFVNVWMWKDARKHGINPLPYVIGTVFTGSISPMVYLLRRPSEERAVHGKLVTA